jgi:DNA mismatch repair protein MutL
VKRIRLLPEDVANRIAAGEVVERPASLAKELVENSLDADAKRIEVVFEGGGLDSLRVADDGSGIAPEDVELAFARHATSKVWDPKDLAAISTLGFRGEALASIAAVSSVELLTAPDSSDTAVRVRLEAGRVLSRGRAARSRGTTIEVTKLFFNTPARRKFLRTPATEGRLLVRTLGQLALGAPGVGFRVTRERRIVLDIAPSADFRERTRALFGGATVARMVEVRSSRENVDVRGLVSPSEFARTRGNYQVLLVNGRPVSDAALSHAVTSGIGGAIPAGRSPIFALAITVEPSEVDVNVHPTKREVRFRRKDLVFSVVREAVAASVLDTRFDTFGREATLGWRSSPVVPARVREAASRREGTFPALEDAVRFASGERAVSQEPSSAALPREERRAEKSGAPAKLRLVGEIFGAYLLVEDENRLLVIDQHAAHERVLYDEIREAEARASPLPVQGLLMPLAIELGSGQEPEDAALQLRGAGFDARAGGASSIFVEAIPGALSRWGGGEFLRELFASAEAATESAEKFRDALAKGYACKGAVKFGQRLKREEIEHLLRRLERTGVPRLCPHGRPIYLEVTRATLDDRFER